MPPLADRATTNSQSAANEAIVAAILPADASAQDDAVHISAVGAATEAQDGIRPERWAQRFRAARARPASGVSAVSRLHMARLGSNVRISLRKRSNAFYTAGRWLAAGITVGGIVSLLV